MGGNTERGRKREREIHAFPVVRKIVSKNEPFCLLFPSSSSSPPPTSMLEIENSVPDHLKSKEILRFLFFCDCDRQSIRRLLVEQTNQIIGRPFVCSCV